MQPSRPFRAAILFLATVLCPSLASHATAAPTQAADSVEARNKALARAFYEDLWFSDRTHRWDRYVADEYVVHDIGDTKGVVEPGIQQKGLADWLHSQGEMGGSIDFQIAEGDLVATRWQWDFEPTSLPFRLLGGRNPIPIINVFRFEDGKIVEIWNHRHDIDTGRGNIPFVKGLGLGLALALVGWGLAFVQWRRSRRRLACLVAVALGSMACASSAAAQRPEPPARPHLTIAHPAMILALPSAATEPCWTCRPRRPLDPSGLTQPPSGGAPCPRFAVE